MSYGFFAAGNAGNLIIGDDNPVLRRAYSGELRITQVERQQWPAAYKAMYAFCAVTYPSPIGTVAPPLVFGSPNGAVSGAGLCAFMPLGSAGNWTGFRVVCKAPGAERLLHVGESTGWTYHACVHEPENFTPGRGFGLRLFNVAKNIIFDSSWAIVPFRSLLTNWSLASTVGRMYDGKFRGDWGNRNYNQQTNNDYVRQYYTHAWGASDGTLGVLISSLSGWEITGDAGFSRAVRFVLPPTIFFSGSDRTKIHCLVDAGIWQHPTIDRQAMNRFSLLTGDISRL